MLQQIRQQLLHIFTPQITEPSNKAIDLQRYRFGQPQRSGPMTVLPIFGPARNGYFATPLTGLKLTRVAGYGNVELCNPTPDTLAIVPLHIGYIQDEAQNHALCRSAFLAGGQALMFKDACCVQAAQGGYLEGREQWFFILPLQLRYQALQLRGQEGYSKLWDDISDLNEQFGYPNRGHLEQILTRQRPYLTQYQTRFELLPGQIGAVFFLNDTLVGVEIAPSVAYFAELWVPLVCFCYGAAAMYMELKNPTDKVEARLFPAKTLPELKQQLKQSREAVNLEVQTILESTSLGQFETQPEENFLSMQLLTLESNNFAGQVVQDDEELIYVSLFAKMA